MTVRVTSLRGAAAGEYYVSEVGSYHLAAAEPRGRWFGDAAARLGLSGAVDDGAFVLLSGVDPSSRVPLGRAIAGKLVRGYDVTFSAPKSVSILAAVADPRTRAAVHAAHDAAVQAEPGYVQRHALTRFRVEGEVTSVDADGIAVGVFRQHVSRESGPQLHSHAVVAAKVVSPDGRWLALDARPLMADQTVLSGLYHAGLCYELTRRLGAACEVPVNGIAEMTGLDREGLPDVGHRHHLYLRTEEGFLVVAAITDCCSRMVVGRAVVTHQRTELAVEALNDAVARRRPAPAWSTTPTAGMRATHQQRLSEKDLTSSGSCSP